MDFFVCEILLSYVDRKELYETRKINIFFIAGEGKSVKAWRGKIRESLH